MGTSLGEIIFDIGAGIPGGKKFKAVQLGGPSGGCIPAEHLNIPPIMRPSHKWVPSWDQEE